MTISVCSSLCLLLTSTLNVHSTEGAAVGHDATVLLLATESYHLDHSWGRYTCCCSGTVGGLRSIWCKNAQEEPVFMIDGPCCICKRICCPCKDVDFHVRKSNYHGNYHASIDINSITIRVARCPVLTGQSGFLAICPVKNMMLNRTISCPVFGRPWKLHEIWSVDS